MRAQRRAANAAKGPHGRVYAARNDAARALAIKDKHRFKTEFDDEAKQKYPQGWKTLKPYLRVTPQPNK